MDAVPIQKRSLRRPDGATETTFVVTAIALQTPNGRKLIPNPGGHEAASYPSLEEAQQAIAQAGFDAIIDGRRVSLARRALSGSSHAWPDSASGAFEALRDLLVEALSDREAAVVANAAHALGELGDPAALTPLMEHLGDDDPGVRKAVAEALGRLGPHAMEALDEAYRLAAARPHEKNAVHVRLTIVTAYLETFHAHRELLFQILPRLQSALRDEHWLIRAQAALAAGQAARLWQDGQLKRGNG